MKQMLYDPQELEKLRLFFPEWYRENKQFINLKLPF